MNETLYPTPQNMEEVQRKSELMTDFYLKSSSSLPLASYFILHSELDPFLTKFSMGKGVISQYGHPYIVLLGHKTSFPDLLEYKRVKISFRREQEADFGYALVIPLKERQTEIESSS